MAARTSPGVLSGWSFTVASHRGPRSESRSLVLIRATPEGYQEKGSFTIPNVKDPSWSHPVIAGGRLYLREQDTLYAYDVKAS